MRVSVLIENTARKPGLTAEHGLSLYIETGTLRLLFDTGATGAFAENAVKMGVDLSKVDGLILSTVTMTTAAVWKPFLSVIPMHRSM